MEVVCRRAAYVIIHDKITSNIFHYTSFFTSSVLTLSTIMRPALRTVIRRQVKSQHTLLPSRCRCFSQTTTRRDNRQESSLFPGYTLDALDAPLHSSNQHISRPYADPSPEDPLSLLTPKDERLARAKAVFGDRARDALERQRDLSSRSRMIAGVLVPPKPEEPDNCCMSGCVNCVWERYREEVEEFADAWKEVRRKQGEMRMEGKGTGLMVGEEGAPSHVAVSMDDDGGGSESLWTEMDVGEGGKKAGQGEDVDVNIDPLAGVPIGIREFMKTEKKLKEMHRARGERIEKTALDTELRPANWAAS